jgi:hypothetical protein
MTSNNWTSFPEKIIKRAADGAARKMRTLDPYVIAKAVLEKAIPTVDALYELLEAQRVSQPANGRAEKQTALDGGTAVAA